jgi:hypothetical protein
MQRMEITGVEELYVVDDFARTIVVGEVVGVPSGD